MSYGVARRRAHRLALSLATPGEALATRNSTYVSAIALAPPPAAPFYWGASSTCGDAGMASAPFGRGGKDSPVALVMDYLTPGALSDPGRAFEPFYSPPFGVTPRRASPYSACFLTETKGMPRGCIAGRGYGPVGSHDR